MVTVLILDSSLFLYSERNRIVCWLILHVLFQCPKDLATTLPTTILTTTAGMNHLHSLVKYSSLDILLAMDGNPNPQFKLRIRIVNFYNCRSI